MTDPRARPERSSEHGREREGADRALLLGFLRRLDRRDRLGPMLQGALAGAALGLAALLARALLGASGLHSGAAGVLLELLAWVLPVAGAASGFRRGNLDRAAALGDRRAGLLDLLKTAHGLEHAGPAQAAWRPLLEHRAAEQVRCLDPSRLVPLPWRRLATLATLLIALVLAHSIPSVTGSTMRGALTAAPERATPAGGTADAGAGAPDPAEPEPEPEPEPPRLRLTVDDLPRVEPGEREALEAAGEGELTELAGDAEAASEGESADASGDAAARQELLQEVRRQLEEAETLPPAPDTPPGAEAPGEAGETAPGGEGGPTPPADPSLEQVSDQLTAIEAPTSTPSSQLSERSAGAAEVAVPAGMEVEAGDAPREGSETGDPGVAEGGASTAPQEGFVDPLGEQATELEVTLELALLESARQEAARETTREMTPSRAAESTLAASARAPVAPARESAPVRRAVPWAHRTLVRSYFEPSPPEGAVAADTPATPDRKDSP